MTRDILKDIRPGDIITAKKLNDIQRAINENTKAIAGPREVLQPAEELENTSLNLVNEVYTVGAADITSTTVTITDSNGDTHDIERIDSFTATESTTGKTVSYSFTYT